MITLTSQLIYYSASVTDQTLINQMLSRFNICISSYSYVACMHGTNDCSLGNRVWQTSAACKIEADKQNSRNTQNLVLKCFQKMELFLKHEVTFII